MPDEAIYHRTLSLANADRYRNTRTTDGQIYSERVYWVPGYFLDDVLNNKIRIIHLWAKPGQNFVKYATAFEKEFSALALGGFRLMDPIVDDTPAEVQSGANTWPDQEVIAHLGWVSGSFVHVPAGRLFSASVTDLLAENVPVWVRTASPSGYVRHATEERFLLATHIDGRVLWYLNEDIVGLESSSTGKTAGVAGARKAAGVSTGQILKKAVKSILRLPF